MNSRLRLLIIGMIAVSIGTGLFFFYPRKTLVPKNVQDQVNFQILVPERSAANFETEKNSVKYDKNAELLTYVIKSKDKTITISQQAYPEILIFDKLIGSLNLYGEVQTQVGKIALTRPKDLNGGQAAVLNYNNQVLIFARPDKDLNETEWREFFNNLKVTD